MRRRSFLLSAVGAAAAVTGGLWLKDNVLWRKPKPVFPPQNEWIALESSGLPLPVVKATVAGREVLALIDSGAQYSVIDAALAEVLIEQGGTRRSFDVPMLAYGVGGNAQIGRGTTADMAVGGVSISDMRLAILDLGPLAGSEGPGVSLIIGRDLLREIVVDLDLTRNRVRLLSPQGWSAPPNLQIVQTHMQGDAVAMEVSVEGAVIRAILDTGASSLLSLSESTAEEARILDGRAQREGQSLVLGGVIRARWVEVATVTIADDLKRKVRVPVFADSPLPNYPDALVGIGAFEGRRLVLDLSRSQFYLNGQLDLTIN